jgi:hypothetical protein
MDNVSPMEAPSVLTGWHDINGLHGKHLADTHDMGLPWERSFMAYTKHLESGAKLNI